MKKLLPIFAILTFMILMLVRPDFYVLSARNGIAIYATTVLPALFPFFFCTTLLTRIGAVDVLSKIGKRPVKFLFNAPPESAYIFFMSLMSGYPTGASMTADLFENNLITKEDAKCIFSFCSTSGPIFILGTVGSVIFNDYRIGIIVLVSHYLGSIANGIIFRKRTIKNTASSMLVKPLNTDNILQDTVSKATMAMLAVGGYIVLTGMLIDTLELVGLTNLITTSLPQQASQPILALLYGFFEMTRGSMASSGILNLQLACGIVAASVSFGGLAVLMQSYGFMSKCGVKFGHIFIRKLSQAALSFIIAFMIGFAL